MRIKFQKLQIISYLAVVFLVGLVSLVTILTKSVPTSADSSAAIIYAQIVLTLFAYFLKPIRLVPGERKKKDFDSYLEEIRVKKDLFIDEILMDYVTKRLEEQLINRIFDKNDDVKYTAGRRSLIIKGQHKEKHYELYFQKEYLELFIDNQSCLYLPFGEDKYKKGKKLYDEIVFNIDKLNKNSSEA
jgi:hypothetical protein